MVTWLFPRKEKIHGKAGEVRTSIVWLIVLHQCQFLSFDEWTIGKMLKLVEDG